MASALQKKASPRRGGNRGAGLQPPQVPISSLPCAKPQTHLFLARAAAPPLLLHRFVPPLLRFESSLLRFEPPLLRFESSSLFSTDLCLGFTAPCAAPPVLASGSSGDRTTGTCEHLFLSLQLHSSWMCTAPALDLDVHCLCSTWMCSAVHISSAALLPSSSSVSFHVFPLLVALLYRC